jgi:hypothetical protein
MPRGWWRFASIILAPGKRAGPALAPAINVIADGDFSEEPEKLGLNLHGDPCMTLPGSAVKAACDQFRFSTAIG